MPCRSKGECRPTDVIGNAMKVAWRATGKEQKEREVASSAAAILGKLRGAARAWNLIPEQRAEIARKAAMKKWSGSAEG